MDFREPLNSPLLKSRPGSSRKRESFKEKNNNSLAVPKSWSDDTGLNSITPTSGIDLLIRQALARSTTPSYYDEHGNPVMPPASPLRRSMQPLENIADRMRQKRKSWYDGQIDDDEGNDNDVGGGKGEGKVAAVPTTRLLDLPTELQILVISHLALSDLERLRRTCQYYRFLLSPEYIRTLFGGRRRLAWHLTGHCHECLEEPGRDKLILKQLPIPRDNNGIGNNNNLQHGHAASHAGPRRQNIQRPIYLPGSKCFNCSVRDGDLRVGTYFNLADGENKPTWPCRWCGWPVTDGGSWVHEQFHIPCYARYRRVLFVFMYLGIAQMLLGVVAATLNLVYLRHEVFVLAPTVVNVVLGLICVIFLMFRGNRRRTYSGVLIIEFIIMLLWIFPIFIVSDYLRVYPNEASYIAVMAFCAVNMLCRLLNVVGNFFLSNEYDMTKHYRPQITWRRRILNLIMTGLIYWTYPQCVEQKYPPHYR